MVTGIAKVEPERTMPPDMAEEEGKQSETPNKRKPGEYSRYRKELKEQILKEVMDELFPEKEELDMTEYVTVAGSDPKGNFCVELLKFLGCRDVSVHEAVLNGSPQQLIVALKNLTTGEDPDPLKVNKRDDDGRTALSVAVKCRRSELVEILLEYKANPNLLDLDTGMSPLMFAVTTSNITIARLLVDHKADVNHVDFHGVTPLMLAASFGDYEIIKLLLDNRAVIDFVDLNGWSALHYAAFSGDPDSIALLLEEGADRKLRNFQNRRPVHIAKSKGYGEAVSVLEGKKTKLYIEEKYGEEH